ncbi:MAG: ABC transporter ATP-binding protein [Candidatus Bathyarchaeota archaeon]|nr:ABC transporter ATP-binding protein [Candidatus Bathyarchaeota archaeon]
MKMKIIDTTFPYENENTALDNIQLNVETNDVLSILGPTGAGKTTLLTHIRSLLETCGDTVMVDGEELRRMGPIEAVKKMRSVPQRTGFSKATVFDSVMLEQTPPVSKKDIEIAQDLIGQLGLSEVSLKHLDEISIGDLQKVQLAQALVKKPKVLLLDEPTNNFDVSTQHQIMSAIVDFVKRNDSTAIMALYDINLALCCSNKFAMLKNGKIFTAGQCDVITPENIEAVYGFPVNVVNFMGKPMIMPL